MNSGKVFLGVLAGVAAGALLGILFAPDEGKKTRKKILNDGKYYVDDLKSKFGELGTSITEMFESTMEESEALIAKGKSKYEETKKELKNVGA